MGNFLAALSALGGVAVFIAGVWAIVRGVFRLAEATRDNTKATKALIERMNTLTTTVEANTRDIATLKRQRPRRAR